MVITLQKNVRFLSGSVEQGKRLGRTIGFPTANLKVAPQLQPSQGVYGVYVYRGNRQYIGVMNIGNRPTFKDGNNQTVEVHILDFNEFIYDEILVVEVLFLIREEKKFLSLEALTAQLQQDVAFARTTVYELSAGYVAL